MTVNIVLILCHVRCVLLKYHQNGRFEKNEKTCLEKKVGKMSIFCFPHFFLQKMKVFVVLRKLKNNTGHDRKNHLEQIPSYCNERWERIKGPWRDDIKKCGNSSEQYGEDG